MICGECAFARIDRTDDEDIYYCPFDEEYAFHSGELCSHERDYIFEMIERAAELSENQNELKKMVEEDIVKRLMEG